jgi:radical SAM C-methyltransferase
LGGQVRITIVQQGAWDAPLPTMPLAAGYLRAVAEANPAISSRAEVRIENLPGGGDLRAAAVRLFSDSVPDVIAFSVLGWNQRTFGELARTYKQLRPDGLVIFGGNHVSHQASRVFSLFPDVDIVVNGEGERTFEELLLWWIEGAPRSQLHDVRGISFRESTNGLISESVQVVVTPDRPRCEDLDSLPSPFLSGAIPLTDDAGRFPYDVALMETNRGCPYKCSFCYWGGAIGARVHEFSRERLREELELLGSHGVESVVLCDANFGMRSSDLRFVEDFIEVRNALGAPRYLEASWTKNKSDTFFEIVSLMKAEGLSSSFTLALQSLDGPTLEGMARRNMQLNEWTDVATFLRDQDLECYAELIWGAPGESPESFFAGYDALARVVPRIAVYPLLVIPNTSYDERRAEYGLVTVRGTDDDFEYVLSHDTMTAQENLEVQRVVFWARVLAENALLRWCWPALELIPGLTQSGAIRAFADRVDRSELLFAEDVRSYFRPFADSTSIGAALRCIHSRPAEALVLFETWWEQDILARAKPESLAFLRSVFRFDWLTRPVYVEPGTREPLPVEEIGGEAYYVHPVELFDHDVPGTLGAAGFPLVEVPAVQPQQVQIVAKVGFHDCVENHEMGVHYTGRPRGSVRVNRPGGAEG